MNDAPAPDTGRDHAGELAALFASVQAAPHAHDFFALLRRTEALQHRWPRFGRAPRPSQEALRFGQEPELDFAPAALATFTLEPHAAPRLGVRFFGLLGPQGPMPLHLTEHVRERLRYRNDPTTARFLDVFHHRLLALFYRAWAESQPTAQHDRPHDDRFASKLGATIGLDPCTRAPAPGSLPESAQRFQAGLLGARSRHPEGLTKLLTQFFGVPVRLESHVPHWLTIDRADQSRLGPARGRAARAVGASASAASAESAAAPATSAALGGSATVGHKLRDRQYKFRLALGPLTWVEYRRFMPGGSAWRPLCDAVRQYVGLGMSWDVQLCLARAEVPEPRLGRGVPLGVATWLGGQRGKQHRMGNARDACDGRDACDSHDRREPRDPRHPRATSGTRPATDPADLRLRPDTCFLLRRGAHHA